MTESTSLETPCPWLTRCQALSTGPEKVQAFLRVRWLWANRPLRPPSHAPFALFTLATSVTKGLTAPPSAPATR